MVSAIGATPFYSNTVSAPSAAGLAVQLDQYKIKLADWENCASCNTAEGKAKIAEISDKISELKARMEAADTAKERQRTSAPDVNAASSRSIEAGSTSSSAQGVTPSATQSSLSTLGSRVDVFA